MTNDKLLLVTEIGNTTLGVSVMQGDKVLGVDYWDTIRTADAAHYAPIFCDLV